MVEWGSAIAVIATLIALWQLFIGTSQSLVILLAGLVLFVGYVVYSNALDRISALENGQNEIREQLKYHGLDKRVTILEMERGKGK